MIFIEIFFPTNLINLFINARGLCFLDPLGFSLYMILLTVYNESFISSFLICFVFLFLDFFVLAKNYSTRMVSGHMFLICRGKFLVFCYYS